jgi:hypothetical protein
MRSPGIEPGSITWQATIITTRPRALNTYLGGVAQMVERTLSMREAQGSIPCSSTFFIPYLP